MRSSMLSKRQILGIVFGVIVMTFIAHYDDFLPYRWRMFTASDGSFSGQFPGEPKIEDQQMQVADGGTTVLHSITAAPTKTTSYRCAYFEDPRLASGSPQKVINAALDGSVSKIQGRIVTQQDIDFDGRPARNAEVRARGNSLVEVRIIIAGRRTFMLMVVDTARQKADTKNVQKFFDSIKFSK